MSQYNQVDLPISNHLSSLTIRFHLYRRVILSISIIALSLQGCLDEITVPMKGPQRVEMGGTLGSDQGRLEEGRQQKKIKTPGFGCVFETTAWCRH